MEWRDEGLIIGLRRHGEASVILEVMTRAHGRHMGMVRSGRSRAMQPVLQPGNSVELVWRARLDEHLGTFAVEPLRQRAAAIMESALALSAMAHLGQLLRFLPERDPHPPLFEALTLIADHLDDRDIAPALMVRFELEVLTELGFGVDLSACAATGARENLAYVSPKSGRAVSAAAGAPWASRLLPLPPFLLGRAEGRVPVADVLAGFRMTEYFLERDVLAPRGHAPLDARRSFIAALGRWQVETEWFPG